MKHGPDLEGLGLLQDLSIQGEFRAESSRCVVIDVLVV